MKQGITVIVLALMTGTFIATLPARQQAGLSLRYLTPVGYDYKDAAGCADCKGVENSFMPRAAGVDISGEVPVMDKSGWLASVHARSQSHEGRIDTACAWCHAPLTAGATRNKGEGKVLPAGNRQGVTCGACHPGQVEREKRLSLLVNYNPGTDRSDPKNYIFRSRTAGRDFNAQCRFCHHQSHDLLIEAMSDLWEAGGLRCVDCHMAAFSEADRRVERFHNFKVKTNLPHSCSGGLGRSMTCHEGKDTEWFEENIDHVKGPRKTWSDE
jgi:hypothetical protein